ncbi:MAG: serine/threonine protein kinase, partial [Acidobacteriota bacterium]
MSAPDDVPTRHPATGPAPSAENSPITRPEAEIGPDTGRELGRFRLDALIGRGGMGRVYEAWDPRLRRTVAVKVLRGESPVAVRRFVREARSQAGVQHPGICPVY